MKTRKKIINALTTILLKNSKNDFQLILDIKSHNQKLERHLKQFSDQKNADESLKTFSEMLDALIYLQACKLEAAQTENNEKKIKLHEEKLKGLQEINDYLGQADSDCGLSHIGEILNNASRQHPLLTAGYSSLIKEFFNEVAPGWENANSTGNATGSSRFFSAKIYAVPVNSQRVVLLGEKYSTEKNILVSTFSTTVNNTLIELFDLRNNLANLNLFISHTDTTTFLIMLDTTNSLTNMMKCYKEVKKHLSNPNIILVDNTSTSQNKQAVSTEKAKEYAKKIGASYFEMNAENNKNIDTLLDAILSKVERKNASERTALTF